MPHEPTAREELSETEEIDLKLELGLDRIKSDFDVFRAIDEKTGIILGFVIVSVAELLGLVMLGAIESSRVDLFFPRYVVVLFVGGVVAVIFAMLCGLAVLVGREFSRGSEYPDSRPGVKARILIDVLDSVRENKKQLKRKAKWAKFMTLFVVAGLFLYASVLILVFLRVVSHPRLGQHPQEKAQSSISLPMGQDGNMTSAAAMRGVCLYAKNSS